jgi:hypothetical protein
VGSSIVCNRELAIYAGVLKASSQNAIFSIVKASLIYLLMQKSAK